MKKRLVSIKDFTELQAKIRNAKKQIKNELTEDAADLKAALVAMLDELENAEVEVDEEQLDAKVREMLDAYNKEELPESVANAIANVEKRIVNMQKTMPTDAKLTPAIKNQISAAILKARGKEDVRNSVEAVLTKNGISGMSFEATVDYAVVEGWGNSNPLFAALKKTPFSKFFYSSQAVDASGVRAHGWDKTSESEKTVQAVSVTGKTISTQYIYKRQQIAQEDLDDMREVNGETTFLRWLNEELDRQIVNSIVAVMLGSSNFSDITTIEALPGAATDAFRTAVSTTATAASGLTIEDLRNLADAVKNPDGKAKWLVIDQSTLTAVAAFVYASGGSTYYRSLEELKGQIGVSEIYVTDLATSPICFLPDGYWVKEKNSLSVAYPQWENNVMNYQKERNIGGGIHDLKSVAFFSYAS